MASRYRTRHKRKKRSTAEEFDIGVGKYVHDVEFTSPPIYNGNDHNTFRKSWDDSISHINEKNPCSSNERNFKKSLCTKNNTNIGKFVHNVEFSQSKDVIVDSDPQRNNIDIDSPSLKSGSDSISKSSILNSEISCNKGNKEGCSSVAHGSSIHNTLENNRPNYTKLHEDYVKTWRNNPPHGESRPMRLLEYIYSLCDGKDDFSEDSFDRDLKKYRKKRGKPIREIMAEKDALYEAEKKEK